MQNLFEIGNYPTAGNVRNVCFVMPDGKMIFLNYAYLVAGEYNSEDSTITLSFTSHMVSLRGYNLESIYVDLMFQLCKQVNYIDERYETIEGKGHAIVTNILVEIPE